MQAKIDASHRAEIDTAMSRLFFFSHDHADRYQPWPRTKADIHCAFALNNKICAKRFLTGRDSRARFFSPSGEIKSADSTSASQISCERSAYDSTYITGCRIVAIVHFSKDRSLFLTLYFKRSVIVELYTTIVRPYCKNISIQIHDPFDKLSIDFASRQNLSAEHQLHN